MRKSLGVILLILLVFGSITGCGGTKSQKNGDVNLEYSTNLKKSVELPDSYPKNKFPIYQDAVVSAVQQDGKNLTVVCFSKDKPTGVTNFYKDLLKSAQVLTTTQNDNEFMTMGVKDGYTYTVTVGENDGEESKAYPTVFCIILLPAEAGMEESLQKMKGLTGGAAGNLSLSGGSPSSQEDDGEYIISQGVTLPSTYPQDLLPIYGGSSSSVAAAMSGGESGGMVGYQTKKELNEVIKFYEDQLADADDFSKKNYGKQTVFSGNKEGYIFKIMLMANEPGTKIDPSFKTLVQLDYRK